MPVHHVRSCIVVVVADKSLHTTDVFWQVITLYGPTILHARTPIERPEASPSIPTVQDTPIE